MEVESKIQKLFSEIDDDIEEKYSLNKLLTQVIPFSNEAVRMPVFTIEEKFGEIKRLLDEINNKKSSDFIRLNTLYCKTLAAYYELNGNEDKCSELLKQCELNGIRVDKKDDVTIAAMKITKYLNYINARIEMTNFPSEKAKNYNRIANFYYKRSEIEERKTFMRSITYWQYAEDNYAKALECVKNDGEAVLGYAKCLFKLSKYNEGLNHLKSHSLETLRNINDNQKVEFYLLMSQMERKIQNYSESREHIDAALKINPNDIFAENESKILNNCMPEKQKEKMNEYKATSLDYDEDYFKTHNSVLENNQTYNILSIDGGGIRGIIPAVWLCEIEKRAHRPISHLFNMVAGTSTGGIIAGGLAIPKEKSTFTPQYRAWDILDIYLNRANEIFQKGSFLRRVLQTATFNKIITKYTDDGRKRVLTEFFGNSKLSDSLIDVVIPAANERNLIQTYLFNNKDAKFDPFLDDRFVDVLMATSAAPSFFPSYQIPGKGIFDDGGVHVNNPTSVAISEALRYNRLASQRHFVVSMGTGATVPNGWNNSNRTNLFWAVNLQDVALQAQMGNTDIVLCNSLGKENYKRWQVWFEDPIALDECENDKLSILTDKAHQFIEELDYSDDNSMNMLVERLLLNADNGNVELGA